MSPRHAHTFLIEDNFLLLDNYTQDFQLMCESIYIILDDFNFNLIPGE